MRLFHLLKKTEGFIEQDINLNYLDELQKLIQIESQIKGKLSYWKATLAFNKEMNGEYDSAENEWLAALSFFPLPHYYMQYAHAVLRNKNLYVSKDIEENMKFISKYNVADVKKSLKRVRSAVKVSIVDDDMRESGSYVLAWVEELEKAIDDDKGLIKALSTSKKTISLEESLSELNQLIGLDSVKKKVKQISDWITFTQMRKEQGFKVDSISLHMVFSGQPGTGKTTVARIIANIYKAMGILKKGHLVEVGRSDLVAEYVGQTAIKTMKKIKEAEGGILFIDEAYSLTRSQGNDFGIEAIDTLVKEMEDNRKNLVVILAGYPDEMKQFIEVNPGLQSRFKYHIHFPDYSIDELMEIHQLLLKKKQYNITSQASKSVKRIIEYIVRTNSNHGNGRLVRNVIEDEILSKAAYVIDRKQSKLPIGELDTIDEIVIDKMEMNLKLKEDNEEMLHQKEIPYSSHLGGNTTWDVK
ncbi:AAA family ATPase [Priestia aryabhattai]|uniref:AAA family ATPase n=1 Tax=Priestia aryabhattai TaxID=412384 RepID=UPI0021AF50F4|nr:AAA family ATPase [Priestia aryabhattai]